MFSITTYKVTLCFPVFAKPPNTQESTHASTSPSFFFLNVLQKKKPQNNKQKLSHELSQEIKRKRFKYQLTQTFWKKLVLFTLIYVTEFNISCIADASLTLKHWVTALYFRIYLRVKLMFEKKQMQLIALGKQWLFLLGITPAPVCPVQG